MSFLSLSTELIEKIASFLRAQDLAVLRLCCRRTRHIVEGSLLLQYLYRVGQAGVYDPLWDLPSRSIVERIETLERWEASWNNIGKYLAVPRLVIPAERDLFGPFFLCDDYLFAPALLYVDLRDALRSGQHRWKQIDYPPGSIAITQAFSIEEDDLVVSVLSLPRVDSSPTMTVLRFMSLETGGAHPQAKHPDLKLDTQLPVSLLDVRADVIGDQIVLVLVDLRNDLPERDAIYLVDWRQGTMSLVHRAPHGTYEGALSVLSPELVLFLKRDSPSLELCRVTRGTGHTPPSLRVVRTLALPPFSTDYRVHTAYMQTDRHSARQRTTTTTTTTTTTKTTATATAILRPSSPLPFHSAPDDMVVGITFLLRQQRGQDANWKKVVTTISHRALFALAAVEDDYDVAWDEWGPRAARVIAPDAFQWITAHAGQRWLSLEADKLVIRDFSAVRVRRAVAAAGEGNENDDDGVPVLPPGKTVISGGSACFAHDVASALPFVETRVEAPRRDYSMVLTDGEQLVAFVRSGQPPTFDIHVLEEHIDAPPTCSSSAASRSSRNHSRTRGETVVPSGSSYQLA
ncbi:hypothetical protein EI94DRAFT_1740257 [Lactarius quietus]|nr:hypothetical protein EI94DRAFT_1740257 [Lactarius quietus]